MGINKKSAGKTKIATKKTTLSKTGTRKLRGVSNKIVDRRKNTRKPYISPLGLDVQLLEQSFKILEPNGTKMVKRFYQLLFKRYPGLKTMFSGTTAAKQETKLLSALKLVIKNLRDPDTLVDTLAYQGKMLASYGALPEHYAAAASTLMGVLKEFTGDMWTMKMHDAWSAALETIAATMLKAYDYAENNQIQANRVTDTTQIQNDELVRLRAAIDGSMTAIMMVDHNLIVTYMNVASQNLLNKNASALTQMFVGFRPEAIIGTCIDRFLKKPAEQRGLLSDLSRLPVKAGINLGDLKFQLNVTGITDNGGNYMGNMLEWRDITEQKIAERQIQKLIEATIKGELHERINTDELKGFLKGLGRQINQLMDAVVEPTFRS